MRFGWLTLALSPSPEEDAVRIDQQIEQVQYAESLGFHDRHVSNDHWRASPPLAPR